MRLLPAPAGSGIVFRRTDLDNFEIPAIGRNVAKVSYATSLMRQGVLISTTEHLLSALIGMGVDNVIVELDNLELPILDGSALPYVRGISPAWASALQRRRRETVRVLRPVEVREGNKFIGVYPGSGYSIQYAIDFPAPIGRQTASVDLAAETYGAAIAPARTFGYKADEQRLRDMGLIRGASAGERHHSGRNRAGERPAALRRRVCAPQGAGPDRRSGPGRAAHRGPRGGRARRSRHAHRAGFALAQGPLGLGAGACAGGPRPEKRDGVAGDALASPALMGCLRATVSPAPAPYIHSKQNAHRRSRRKALAFFGQSAGLGVAREDADQVSNPGWPPASSAPWGPG